jgi:hypothetical protein
MNPVLNKFQSIENMPRVDTNGNEVGKAIKAQLELRSKYNYKFSFNSDGRIRNNTTMYMNKGIAHYSQIEEVLNKAIQAAKNQPDIFGRDFECDVKINLIKKYSGEYLEYGFVDFSNPSMFYALAGLNPDGTERVIYNQKVDDDMLEASSTNWSDQADLEDSNQEKVKLPPLITLEKYEYDDDQKQYLDVDSDYGSIILSPALISAEIFPEYNPYCLYVNGVPNDYEFLSAIFSRYSRYGSEKSLTTITSHNKGGIKSLRSYSYYPKITIKTGTKTFAIVEYSHVYDAAFALLMLKKIRAKYKQNDVELSVRYAILNKK